MYIPVAESTEVVEDEEADPEYNILEDKEDALDLREEMRGDRAVQISKKEIQQLMTELLDTLDGDERSDPIRAHLSQHMVPREVKKSPFKTPQICQPDKDRVGHHYHYHQHHYDYQHHYYHYYYYYYYYVLQEGGPAQGSIWVEVVTAKFSASQFEVLQCQMMQHVQLLATSVLMAHGSHQYQELKQIGDACTENLV